MAVNPDGRPLAGRWIIASAQHLIERSTLGGPWPSARRTSGHGGGSTLTERVSTARRRSHRLRSFHCALRGISRATGDAAMTDRIMNFLANHREDGPRLVVDLDVVRENYYGFAKALPDTRVFYAVKANPAPEILDLLARLGSCFDTASVVEIEQAMAAGATPDRISLATPSRRNATSRAPMRLASGCSRSIA